jgi:uncharacterized protein
MKIMFYMGHPAHFHLLKHTIQNLLSLGNQIDILIKKKDILQNLLDESNIKYINILTEGRKDSKFGIAIGIIKRDIRLFKFCRQNKPQLMVGTSAEIGHVGTLLKIPSIILNEDDAAIVPLFSKISYPFCSYILSPKVCNNGKWENKSIKYNGYHKLAYLHPKYFTPSLEIKLKYFPSEEPYFLIRLAKLTAHHDEGISGINDELANKIVNVLLKFGQVYITSERPLNKNLEKYSLQINPLHIHHVMAYAKLYVGDSQSMAVEACMLGTPNIRVSSFTGRISVLDELENVYGLTKGISPNNETLIFKTIEEFLNMPDLKNVYEIKKHKMLSEKINVSDFFTWFFQNYPTSVNSLKGMPDLIETFK